MIEVIVGHLAEGDQISGRGNLARIVHHAAAPEY
jgi:hypothetical protein